jgi:tripartite ATP-independent transporter DctM subunit
MEWVVPFIVILILLLALFGSGMPVAFAFLTLNLICLYLWAGGVKAWFMVLNSGFDILTGSAFLAVPPFVLMGEILLQTEASAVIINALDKWIGRIPGRLSMLSVLAGTLLAAMTGSTIGSTVMLGSVLVPEMRKHGYHPVMILGPCAASGGLAMLIPPTILGVVMAGLVKISVGEFLIAIVLPGVVLASLIFIYILIRCLISPEIAPPYTGERIPLSQKIVSLVLYVLPTGIIIFFVLVLMFMGAAAPTEAAALGVVGTLIVCALLRKLSWGALMKAALSSARVTVMICMICVGSIAFSQLMAYTGTVHGMAAWAASLSNIPIFLYLMMMLVVLFLGCIMDGISVMMISVPIFIPIVQNIGMDMMWFTVAFLVAVQTGMITPPFGVNLFAIKAVAPEYTMTEVYKSCYPYAICNVVTLGLLYAFPKLATWLPGLMR